MTLALKQVKVYFKFAAIIAAIVVVLLVVLMNRNRTADVWFFREYSDVNVLWLILVTAVLAIVGWWGIRKVVGVLRDLRELRRSREVQRKMDEQRRLAEEMTEREKRIDEKLQRSIKEDA